MENKRRTNMPKFVITVKQEHVYEPPVLEGKSCPLTAKYTSRKL
jgi:hypothetical protein